MRLEGVFSWILALHVIAILLLLSFKGRLSCVKLCLSMLLYATYSILCVCSKENMQGIKKQDESIDPLLSLA